MNIGQTIGSLKVVEYIGLKRASNVSKYDTKHYLCECGCGKQIEVNEASLEYRIVKSCGCNKY
jgi:hypothetical protein